MKRNVFLKRLALGKYLKSPPMCRHVSKQSPVCNTGFLYPVESCRPRGSFLLYWTKGSLPETMAPRGYLWTFSLGGEKDHLRGEPHHPIALLTWSSICAQEPSPHQSPVTLLLLQFPLYPPWAAPARRCSLISTLSPPSLLPPPKTKNGMETEPEQVRVVLRTSKILPWNTQHRHTLTSHPLLFSSSLGMYSYPPNPPSLQSAIQDTGGEEQVLWFHSAGIHSVAFFPRSHKAEDRETWPNSKAMFSNFSELQNHLEGLLTLRSLPPLLPTPPPQSTSFRRSRKGREFVFLTSSLVTLRLLVQALHLKTTAIKETITGHLVKHKPAGPRIGGRRLWSDDLTDFSQRHEDCQNQLQRSSFFLCHLKALSIPWVLLPSSLSFLERPSLGNATLLGSPSKDYVPSIIGTALLPQDSWDERG